MQQQIVTNKRQLLTLHHINKLYVSQGKKKKMYSRSVLCFGYHLVHVQYKGLLVAQLLGETGYSVVYAVHQHHHMILKLN